MLRSRLTDKIKKGPKMRDIVILDGARTPIGTFGGSLADTTPIDLASSVTDYYAMK